MKKVTLALFCLLLSAGLMAQKIYFVYLQTENQQPFFVRMNEKVYSSTASGYLILSRLIDSTYNFQVGFPGKNVDLHFSATINKKDHGYLLRNFGDKGWGLIDLQTLSIQMPVAEAKSSADVQMRLDSNINAFTELLSKAADDSTLKYIAVVREEEKKPDATKSDIIQPVVRVDLPVKTNTDEKKAEEIKTDPELQKKTEVVKTDPQPEKKSPQYKRSEVTKVAQNNVADGVEIVYSDKQQEKTDTITIVIDQPKAIVKAEEKYQDNKPAKKFLDITTDSVKMTDELPARKEETEMKVTDTISAQTDQPEKKGPKIAWPFKNKSNKKCDVADNNDFLKLRRKMAAKTNDDGMIEEARKYFKSKCFTTDQIRNLSSMFLSNAGKYHFFDAAYEYVVDKENFGGLQSELKDDYYLGRFKAMVQN